MTELLDSASGALNWSYDNLNRVTQVSGAQGWVKYGYDKRSRRTAMSTSSGSSTSYGYDERDQVTSIAQDGEQVGMTYDDRGNRTELTLPNGTRVHYDYDAGGDLRGIDYLNAATGAQRLSLSNNADGFIDTATGGVSERLVPQATSSDSTFDTSDRQTQANGFALTYDENGNLTSDGVKTYVWNARNQLVEVREGSSTVLRFQYDATGRRITKELKSGAKVAYLYDGLNAVEEHSGDTVRRVFTGLGIDERFARDDATGRAYYLPDTLGSTAALVDARGQVVKAYAYGPYGEGADDGADDPSQNPYRYTGCELDAPGLYYYRARYYSTDLRRFISEDPIGFDGGQLNFYAYVGGRPTMYSDPTGLCPESGDWWPFSKKNEPTGEIDPTKGPKCPLPMPNDPLKPIPIPGDPVMGCHAAMLDKIAKCTKKCPGVLDRTACIEEWRFREPACVADHAGE